MPATTPLDPDPAVPRRPPPPRSAVHRALDWVAWFGLARLVLAAVSVAVVAAGAFWLLRAPAPDPAASLPVATVAPDPATAPAAPVSRTTPPTTSGPEVLLVHVAGAVVVPGVYAVPAGSRVDAAVAAAGGASATGDLDGLNLAAPLVDGQRIYVPELGQVDPAAVPNGAALPAATDGANRAASGPIDLNSATAAELETLPGVGPATAAAIVDDRDRNGPFLTVDDLDRVPGIGPSRLATLRDLVTV